MDNIQIPRGQGPSSPSSFSSCNAPTSSTALGTPSSLCFRDHIKLPHPFSALPSRSLLLWILLAHYCPNTYPSSTVNLNHFLLEILLTQIVSLYKSQFFHALGSHHTWPLLELIYWVGIIFCGSFSPCAVPRVQVSFISLSPLSIPIPGTRKSMIDVSWMNMLIH